uniref:Uncharacterized protein n=1 Tax=viral metagenome TaxID=1070528 RepID=A0A6M3LIM5_9ZZZZ
MKVSDLIFGVALGFMLGFIIGWMIIMSKGMVGAFVGGLVMIAIACLMWILTLAFGMPK